MKKIEINELSKAHYLGLFITIMQFIAIGLANLTILVLFSKFFTFNSGFIVYLLACFAVSILLLKSDAFFWFGKKTSKKNLGNNNTLISPEQKMTLDLKKEIIKSNLWNAALILFRTLFFNLMDYFFVVIVIWLALLGPFYFINIISIVEGFNITTFSEVLATIGIISGFLEIYISQLKNGIIQKVTNAVLQYINLSTSDISFTDFMHYLKDATTNEPSLFNRIIKIIFGDDSFADVSNPRKKITERYFYSLSGDETLYLFSYLDSCEEFQTKKSSNSINLQSYYEEYFKKKLDNFKEKIEESASEIDEIKRVLYANIQMLSEAMADTAALNLDASKEIKNPQTFEEFYDNYRKDCIAILVKDISNKIFL